MVTLIGMINVKAIAAGIFLFVSLVTPSTLFAQENRLNPVAWKTDYNMFSSSDFHIRIGEKYFYGIDPVSVHSDPDTSSTTLELIWKENEVQMRMFMYFRKTQNNMWEMYDLRTYNASGRDWIFYNPKDSLGNDITSLAGQRSFAAERVFKPKNSSIDAEIYCKDCSITAFTSPKVDLSSYGYGIDFRIGIPANEIITVSTNPRTGYGVNALLVDSNYEVVIDQQNLDYKWSVENSNILNINPISVPYPNNKCAYDINPPCPKINAQISGKTPGVSRVLLDIVRRTDGVTLASGSFDVKVVEQVVSSSPAATNQTLTPSPTDNSESQSIRQELNQLRGEVGEVTLQVQKQEQDIGFLRKVILGIQNFLNRIFGRQLQN